MCVAIYKQPHITTQVTNHDMDTQTKIPLYFDFL